MRSGLSWGYAVSPSGELIIRNWYFLCAWVLLVPVSLLCMLAATAHNSSLLVCAAILGCSYICWGTYLEWTGVRVGSQSISYPIRLGFDIDVVPLFRKSVLMSEVLEASSLTLKKGARAVYLSGEFGQAKIVFDTKGGRDRLLALIAERYPSIRVRR